MKVYLDNGDTTRIDERVFDYMKEFYLNSYGNPFSLHYLGIEADEHLESARSIIAKSINANPNEIYFTSGATEANNIIVSGILNFYQDKGKHAIMSSIEHSSVSGVMNRFKKKGWEIDELGVNSEGFIDLEELKEKITPKTVLVSIIFANYEIGTIQKIKEIGEICRKNKVLFHTDAAQALGKEKIDVVEQNIDLLTINAHKNHGPKGVGAAYIKKGIKLTRLMEGGAQEKNFRPGTENLPAIMGFAKAVEISEQDFEKNRKKLISLRNKLASGLCEIDHIFYNGPKNETEKYRLANNVDITFQYIEGEAILMHLSLRGICVSSGSACSSKSLEPSSVLSAIGLKHEQAHGSIRFTISKYTTEEEIEYTIKNVKEVVQKLREMSSFIPSEHSELENEHATTFYKAKKSKN